MTNSEGPEGPKIKQILSIPSYDDTLSALTMEQFQNETLRHRKGNLYTIMSDERENDCLPRVAESSRSPRSQMSPNSQRSQMSPNSPRSQRSPISKGSYSQSHYSNFPKKITRYDLTKESKRRESIEKNDSLQSLSYTLSEADRTSCAESENKWLTWFHCCGMEIRVATNEDETQAIGPLDSATFYDCIMDQSMDVESTYNKSASMDLETLTKEAQTEMLTTVKVNDINFNSETLLTKSHSGTITTCDYPESLGLTTHKSDDFTKITDLGAFDEKLPTSKNSTGKSETSNESVSVDLISRCDSILTKSDCDVDLISQHDSIITGNDKLFKTKAVHSEERDDKVEGHYNILPNKLEDFPRLANSNRPGFKAFPKMSARSKIHYGGAPGRGQVRRNIQLVINNSSTMSVDSGSKRKSSKLSKLMSNSIASLNNSNNSSNSNNDTSSKNCKSSFDASTIRSKYGSQSRGSGSGSNGSYKKRPNFVQVMSSGLLPSTALKVSSRKR